MIDKELMIKKIKNRIKIVQNFYDNLEKEIEKYKKIKDNVDFLFDSMKMMIYANAEINTLKDIIKNIKKGEFNKKQVKLNNKH